MWRLKSLIVLTAVLICGCGPMPVEEPPPIATVEETDVEATPVAETSDAPPEPEFVTTAQLREQLGVGEEAHFLRSGRSFVEAELTNTGVKDLSPLKGQPLHALLASRNPIASLEPLSGMPLEVLDVSETRITTLEPIAKCADLSQLYLEKTAISDISPLKGMHLTRLYLTDCPVSDLSPLEGMQLQELNLCRTKITSLDVLKNVRLGILWIRETGISDLSPLAGKEMTSLDIEGTQVGDLKVLASIPGLQRLDIADTPVTDLSPLAGLQLTRLIFTPQNITAGIDVVRQMSSLREIDTQFEGNQPQAVPANEFWARYDAGAYTKPAAN